MELEGSPVGAELEGSPVSPIVSSPVLQGNSVVSGAVELPANNIAHPNRVDSTEPSRVLRSDPTRPHASSWQYYQDLAQEQRDADIGSWHARSQSPPSDGPYMGATLAHMLWRTPTDELSRPPLNGSDPSANNETAAVNSQPVSEAKECTDGDNVINDGDFAPATRMPLSGLLRLRSSARDKDSVFSRD